MQLIGKLIHTVDIKLKRRIDALATEFDLTAVQFFVMERIYIAAEKGDIFQRDLEAAMDVRRSTISNILGLLEKKGYVRRESVSEDARLKKLILTPAGRQVYKDFKAHLSHSEAQALSCLSPDEIDVLTALLTRLAESIR